MASAATSRAPQVDRHRCSMGLWWAGDGCSLSATPQVALRTVVFEDDSDDDAFDGVAADPFGWPGMRPRAGWPILSGPLDSTPVLPVRSRRRHRHFECGGAGSACRDRISVGPGLLPDPSDCEYPGIRMTAAGIRLTAAGIRFAESTSDALSQDNGIVPFSS